MNETQTEPTYQVVVYMTKDMRDRIDAAKGAETRTAWIRRTIEDALDRMDSNAKA